MMSHIGCGTSVSRITDFFYYIGFIFSGNQENSLSLGIAGAAVILSAQTILSASYGGYIYGISSVISYHYGAANFDELRELPENRKNKGITLTEKGRQLCGDVIVPLLRQEEAAMHEMGEKESAELLRLVELYGNAYCRLVKKYCKVSSDIASVSENT